jgi:NAD(P)-dependent dehydrogenase (short-subunit alcohol dehydrogenase family)
MPNWTAADIPRQDGRVAIITGSNSGLGYHAARELARAGAHTILACRDGGRGGAALERMQSELPGASIELRRVDMASLDSIRAFAAGAPERVDVLLNNAGVMAPPRRETADGFELQFGTNHLGPFALTGLLLSRLEAADAPRVVTASSNMHKMGGLNWADLQSEHKYRRWFAYGHSKLANLLFAFELQRRATAAGSKLLSMAAHPGYAATELHVKGARIGNATFQERVMDLGVKLMAQSSADGALPMLFAATAPDVPGGSYVGPSKRMETVGPPKFTKGSGHSRNEADARRLWEISEQLSGVTYEFERAKVA